MQHQANGVIENEKAALEGRLLRWSAGKSDIEADVSLTGKIEERCCASIFDIIDEITVFKSKQINCHLAGNEFHLSFHTKVTQIRNRCNAVVWKTIKR